MTTKLACSPLTGTIFYGKTNKADTMFVGPKKDMTQDFYECVIVKAGRNGGAFDILMNDRKWTVTVEESK